MSGSYFKSFDGAKIYYHKTLKDPNKWLIFLHGFGGDLTAWQKERAYFSKLNISSIAMDLRGHGLSERSEAKDFYKLENFSKDLEELIKHQNIENFVVVGHCFGGMVSIYFQSQNPKGSKGLILVDTSYKPPFFGKNFISKALMSHFFGLLSRFSPNIKRVGHVDFNKFVGTSDMNIKRITSDMLHTSLRSYLSISNYLINMDASTLLEKISVPTLIIEGEKDSIFPPYVARELNQKIKTSEIEFIKDANHILVINNPKELEKSIEAFLRKINFL